jgi:tetratricopeptide (TPR) repeat protein
MLIRNTCMKRPVLALLPLLLAFGAAVAGCAQSDDWETLNDDAVSLYKQGQYDRALVVAKKALEGAERTGGPDHPDVATSLNNLALLYYSQGQYAQAEPLFKRSLAIREKALGPNHPDVAQSLENLAELYKATNRTEEAEALKKRAEAIRAIKR